MKHIAAFPCATEKRTCRRKAFTLIELLSVVAIIGVLCAILIPVIGSLRDKVEVAQCASNLRQIYIAIRNYANENNDRILHSRRFNDYSQYPDGSFPRDFREHWPTVLIRRGYFGTADIPNRYIGMEDSQGWNLRMYYTVLGCPTLTRHILDVSPKYDSISQRTIPGGRSGFMNYGLNEDLTNLNDAENRQGVYFNALAEPTKTILASDQQWEPNTTGSDIFVSSSLYFPDGIHGNNSERKKKGVGNANILFADGHVELIDVSTLPRKDNADKDYNLYWRGRYLN